MPKLWQFWDVSLLLSHTGTFVSQTLLQIFSWELFMLEDLKHYKGSNVCSSFTQKGISGDAEGTAGQQSAASLEQDAWLLSCPLRQGCWACQWIMHLPNMHKLFWMAKCLSKDWRTYLSLTSPEQSEAKLQYDFSFTGRILGGEKH